MKILVTGASSFVGAHFALEASKDHEVIGIYHSTVFSLPRIRSVRIDLTSSRAKKQLEELDIDVIVHLATKIKENTYRGQSAAEQNTAMLENIISRQKPILYGSSTAVHWSTDIPYVLSRRKDEATLRASKLPYGILRPSAPYGPKLYTHQPKHKESFHTLVDIIRYSPIVPMISHGNYIRTPIHVRDFAQVGLAMIEMGLDGMEFDAGGAESLSMREIIHKISMQLNRSVQVIPIPKRIFSWMAKYNTNFEPSLIEAIDQDEYVDAQPLIFETGVEIRSFSKGVSDLLREGK